ncbi:MAG TPA: hypothetical protein VKE27_00305 [Candidatus Dormibacteraeota bacterium]|nr:hypothetical protein [Candidatus Dormibacteraeota bacterium]
MPPLPIVEAPGATDPRPAARASDGRRGGDMPPLLIHDLLLDFDELQRLVAQEVSRSNWLDAFLLAAGLNQVLEDYLHRDFGALEPVASTVEPVAGVLGRAAAASIRAARNVGLTARALDPRERRLVAWQRELDSAVMALAAASQFGGSHSRAHVERVLRHSPRFPRALRRSVLRLPTCFRSLDQRPHDLKQIVKSFRVMHPERERPILVLGLRTSGSYLAPLYASFLAQEGYSSVSAMTMRPGQRLLAHEQEKIRASVAYRGLLLLTDDPPKSGTSLERTASALQRAGVPRDLILMLLPQLAGVEHLPEPIRGYETYVLPWERWEIQEALSPPRLEAALASLLVGRTMQSPERFMVTAVEHVESIDLGPRSDLKAGSPVRRHVRALIRASVRDEAGGQREILIYAKGVGLGFFGHHSLAVGEALAGFVPELYGVADGLLFRAWLPESTRIADGSAHADQVEAVAQYVHARNQRLRATEDKSLRTLGLNPIWQRIADLLGSGFGRQRVLFRAVLHAAAKRLLEVRNPSVIDGSMALSQWFERNGDAGGGMLKVDYDERAFSNQDTVIDQLYSYDPVFDLAVAAADHELEADTEADEDAFSGRLAATFESLSRSKIEPERWLLYQLLHLSSHERFLESLLHEMAIGAVPGNGLGDLTAARVAAISDRAALAAARIDQRYLARVVLGDVNSPTFGPLCAIDIDGVLETGSLGHSSATPVGAGALRRLIVHGCRPILATGRSLGEVMDRCRSFRLAGGVAEYGAAVYDHTREVVTELLDPDERRALSARRAALERMPGVHVHPAYRRIVRTSDISSGRRQPLPAEVVDKLTQDGQFVAVQGFAQTDLIPARINKGMALRFLARLLNPSVRPGGALAFAIGDSGSDLSMLAEASMAFGPSNSDGGVQASGARIVRGSHQAGLAEAVSIFLDHDGVGCPVCRPLQTSDATRLLLTALSACRAGRWQKLRAGLALTALQGLRR